MTVTEEVREGLKERGIAFRGPISGSHTWLSCAGCEASLIRNGRTIDLLCYGMTVEQVLAFVDMMESK